MLHSTMQNLVLAFMDVCVCSRHIRLPNVDTFRCAWTFVCLKKKKSIHKRWTFTYSSGYCEEVNVFQYPMNNDGDEKQEIM